MSSFARMWHEHKARQTTGSGPSKLVERFGVTELAKIVLREIDQALPAGESHALPELIRKVSCEVYAHDTLQRYLEHPENLEFKDSAIFTCQTIVKTWNERDPHGTPQPVEVPPQPSRQPHLELVR